VGRLRPSTSPRGDGRTVGWRLLVTGSLVGTRARKPSGSIVTLDIASSPSEEDESARAVVAGALSRPQTAADAHRCGTRKPPPTQAGLMLSQRLVVRKSITGKETRPLAMRNEAIMLHPSDHDSWGNPQILCDGENLRYR
jgi:hypothetical protein